MRLLILLTFFVWSSYSVAQVQRMYFNHLTKNDGLPANNVLSIFQDSEGFLWFGTVEGLAKYDGYVVKRFVYDGTTKGLSDNQINSLAEDDKGNIWIGTSNGLNCLDGTTFQFDTTWKKKNPALTNVAIMALLFDSQHQLWIGTTKGLYQYDMNKKTFISKKTVESLYIKSLSEDKQHNLWVGTKTGLYVMDKQTQTARHYLNNSDVSSILNDSKGCIWITDYEGKSLYCATNSTNPNFVKQEGFPRSKFIKISEDKEGNYWLAIRDEGLFWKECHTDKWINIRHDKFLPNGVNSNTPQAIYSDKDGNIWIGFFDMGVDLFDKHRKAFIHIKDNYSPNGLQNDKVRSIYQDSDGDIWVGTKIDGSLAKFNPIDFTFTHYKHDPNNPESISDGSVFCITEDKPGYLWVGTLAGGINLFNKKTGKSVNYQNNPKDENSLSHNTVTSIFKNDDGKVWVCTGNSLDIFDPATQKFKHYKNSSDIHAISAVGTRTVFKDKSGTIWISTSNGLNRYNPAKDNFTHFVSDAKNPRSISNNSVTSMYEDKKGNFWIGTKKGLNLMNCKEGTFIIYTEKDGLPSNSIMGIFDDERGNLWISTTNGLSKFNPANKIFRNYTIEDGLQSNEFAMHSYCKLKDGELFFGGNYGFNMFYPDKIIDNPVVPSVVFTNFLIFNTPVEIGKNSVLQKHISHTSTITLKYDQSVITFEFAALSYTSPEKNNYAYKMEGFEEKWNFVGSQRSATYTNLDPGEYTFIVKASNNDKVWNETGVSIKVIILPPWWKTLWFRILVSTIIVGSAVSFYHIRISVLNRKKELLEKKVIERTLELQESNILLEERQEEILQQTEEIISQKTELEKTYNSLRIVSDFGQKITAQLSLTAINAMIYKYVKSLMDTSAFGIGIYNSKRNEVEFHAFMENEQVLPFFTKKIDDPNSLTAWSIRNRNVLFINNLDNEYKNYVSQLNQHKSSRPSLSLIHIPLIAEDRIIGILVLNSFSRNAYKEKDLDTLKTLASYISIALDNSNAYNIVKNQHEKITHSINYAQTIQHALLPTPKMQDLDYFVIYKPKDVVSGDFYWYTKMEECNRYFIAVVDCTGHGVPGAFMSLIGNLILNETLLQRKIHDPAQILTEINQSLKEVLNQSETKNDDGMDICLCSVEYIDKEQVNVFFAGAKRSLLYYDGLENTIKSVKGDLKGIGGGKYDFLSFHNHELILNKGDILYLTTDGYTDQNDRNRKEFGKVRFTSLLHEIALLPISEQQIQLEKALVEHQQDQEQRDDITVLGLRL